ncbi:MAG: hypothetical protein V3U27_13175 [Candidatus Tectomicrobia bacterium]
MTTMLPGICLADAIVRSQAMKASTIAEFFIEEDHVRVELEVGLNDLPAFQNILPDTLYEKMGFSQSERVAGRQRGVLIRCSRGTEEVILVYTPEQKSCVCVWHRVGSPHCSSLGRWALYL